MKHWIEFLSKKSNKTKQLGKLIRAYEFEILEAKNKLQMYDLQRMKLENELRNELKKHYTDTETLFREMAQAKEKAEKWNSEPISNHKPHTQKKPPKNGSKNPE